MVASPGESLIREPHLSPKFMASVGNRDSFANHDADHRQLSTEKVGNPNPHRARWFFVLDRRCRRRDTRGHARRRRALTMMGATMGLVLSRAARVGWLAALVLALPSSAMAMSNADPLNPAPRWAAYVTTVKRYILQFQEGSCTGTIVSREWVLTAAHCAVTETPTGESTSTPRSPDTFRVVLGRNDLSQTWTGGQWTVDSVSVFPGWNPQAITGDVALLHLHGALPQKAVPLPLAPRSFSLWMAGP